MALSEADIDEDFIRSAGAIVVTGTHFSKPGPAAAQKKAMRVARAAGRQGRLRHRLPAEPLGPRRPCRGRGALHPLREGVGASAGRCCADCDLIVGTEEEIHIAAGEEDNLDALRRIRVALDARRSC